MKTNREIVRQQLIAWCAPPAEGKAYFRPLVCRGNAAEISIFLVHGQGAVPIPPPYQDGDAKARERYDEFSRKYPLEDYCDRLTDSTRFSEMESDVRAQTGKDSTAAIRERIIQFIAANPHPEISVAETTINAYPAKDGAALRREDKRTLERGYDVFFGCLQLFRPTWIILLGKPVMDEASAFFSTRFGVPDFRGKWKDIHPREPQLLPLTFIKLGGSKCRIAVSRSFDKRPVTGQPDSAYTDERFADFCRHAWELVANG
jgi:hypothetical protein